MAKDLVTIVPDFQDKVGTMSVTPQDIRDAESAGYAHYMAKMLTLSEAQREENRKIAEIRKKRFGIDTLTAQQPSTQAILARPKEKDLEHFLRPLPKETIEASKAAQAAFDKGDWDSLDQMVAKREISPDEYNSYKAMQRGSKNTAGQSEKSATGEERKEAAVNAFIYSPPAQLTEEEKRRVVQLTPYSKLPKMPKEEEKPRNLGSRFMHWLWKRGVPVNRFIKRKMSVEEADKDE